MNLSLIKHTLTAMALCPLIACGDDDKNADTTDTVQDTTADTGPDTADTTGDTTPDIAEDTTPDTDTSGPTCDRTGFTAVAQDAGLFFGAFNYIAQSTLDAPVDVLNFEAIEDQGGAATAGTYALDDTNYSECGNCLTLWAACDENLDNCAKKFLVQAGTLQVDTFDESGGTFAGHIADAVFVEVTIDGSFVSTPVDGGETWCLERYDFSATVQ